VLEFSEEPVRNVRRVRKRNIIYFNPPYSCTIKTNVGKKFLQLVERCFPPGHVLRSSFNRNTLKLSYSCMPNMATVLSGHNKKVLKESSVVPTPAPPPASQPPPATPPPPPATPPPQPALPGIRTPEGCNCQEPSECPIPGFCTTRSVVYQGEVEEEVSGKKEFYTGLTGGSFKIRYGQHKHDFTHWKKKQPTTLSKHIWKLKEKGIKYKITWRFLKQLDTYNPASGKCNLCLGEKHLIIFSPEGATLNKRSEINSKCLHKEKFLLVNC
jgi:hypothetical protein